MMQKPQWIFFMESLNMKWFSVIIAIMALSSNAIANKLVAPKDPKYITKPIEAPFERPIGFTLNLAGVASMTAEGRFLFGLADRITLVASPMYQHTVELPFVDFKTMEFMMRNISRLNLGLGVRGHFYEYDSWDGWYIEAMLRGGTTKIGNDPSLWSLIPSLMVGYAAVYESGYTVSFGTGFEWEFLLAKNDELKEDARYLKEVYYGITKLPLIMELSIGWIW